jgi:hypothetical protein
MQIFTIVSENKWHGLEGAQAYHPIKALNSFVLLAGRENGLMLT